MLNLPIYHIGIVTKDILKENNVFNSYIKNKTKYIT